MRGRASPRRSGRRRSRSAAAAQRARRSALRRAEAARKARRGGEGARLTVETIGQRVPLSARSPLAIALFSISIAPGARRRRGEGSLGRARALTRGAGGRWAGPWRRLGRAAAGPRPPTAPLGNRPGWVQCLVLAGPTPDSASPAAVRLVHPAGSRDTVLTCTGRSVYLGTRS
eukprot:SAG31_NODE_1460_length_8241_cov_11.816352_9_plen_173_part_00